MFPLRRHSGDNHISVANHVFRCVFGALWWRREEPAALSHRAESSSSLRVEWVNFKLKFFIHNIRFTISNFKNKLSEIVIKLVYKLKLRNFLGKTTKAFYKIYSFNLSFMCARIRGNYHHHKQSNCIWSTKDLKCSAKNQSNLYSKLHSQPNVSIINSSP